MADEEEEEEEEGSWADEEEEGRDEGLAAETGEGLTGVMRNLRMMISFSVRLERQRTRRWP